MSAEPEFSDFQAEMLNTLSSGGSVKITPQRGQENLAAELTAAMDDLVSLGLARRSNSGRYWAAAGKPGRPEVGEPVNVRLGEYLPRVDEFAASRGMTRAAAIRDLVARGLLADGPAPAARAERNCGICGEGIFASGHDDDGRVRWTHVSGFRRCGDGSDEFSVAAP